MYRHGIGNFMTTIVLIVLFALGCSGSKDQDSILTPEITPPSDISQTGQAESNTHALLGFWWIGIDPETNSVEVIPSRDIAMHFNIRRFLEDGVPCSDCLQVINIEPTDYGTNIIDIMIKHPWPGLDVYTGYDLRGIAMWNGSEVWPTSWLRTQDPDSTDGYVLNADGYTTIFNPEGFPPDGPPIFSYSQGKFATPTMPDSTLNPYKDYHTEPWGRMFEPGQSAVRSWDIRFPSGGPFVMGYAVDVSWEHPDTGDPHKPEPFEVSVIQPDALGIGMGDESTIQVRVYDWQNNPGGVWIECPDLWTGMKYDTMAAGGPEYTIYYVKINNDTGAGEGTYRALVAARDSSTTVPPWDYTMYTFADIEVAVPPNNPPVAAAEADTYSVYIGDSINFTSYSTDPDGFGDLDLWQWDYENDGVWDVDSQDTVHAYDEAGTYFVDHKVTDMGGLSDDLEPDELLEITVSDICCDNAPVAVIEEPPHILTDQEITLVSMSYDPDGVECMSAYQWDLDFDGEYDDAFGEEVNTSWDAPGDYQVGLKVTDNCDLWDVAEMPVYVHVGVTMPEDQDYKTHDTAFEYVSGDFDAPTVEANVPVTNPDGPWDFTALALTDTGNLRASISQSHPSVSGFAGDFIEPYDHFYLTEGIYNFISGSVYIAEGYASGPDRLQWVGLHETDVIGSVNLDPIMEQEFPFWVFSDYTYTYSFPPLIEFSYELHGWGEGLVTVPYSSLTDVPCVVLKYEIAIESVILTGSALVYEWYLDDGTVVAIVAAINSGTDINYDPDTLVITGLATYNALNDVGPY